VLDIGINAHDGVMNGLAADMQIVGKFYDVMSTLCLSCFFVPTPLRHDDHHHDEHGEGN
jgi:hypothetical protein